MPLYIAKCGDLDRCYRCLTHRANSATQLLTKYKSGALVTQLLTVDVSAFLKLIGKLSLSKNSIWELSKNYRY